ncbi:BAH domain protein [Rhizoctonia solani AG-3 Rhs1AP]|uniref:BAH domain protein n=1 Tax=Rhizoctonia solani AG-3 Rhs1AP TaxID=1086054 RepID=X8J5R4_9AGAM|nr:BAH domain protein [Rhizoctonia solani AG-3 Rhs1AP]
MPPSRHARHGPVSFHDIDPTDWVKLGKIFAVHGARLSKLTLGDGTEITTDECVQIASGDDFSETSAPNEVWFAEILDIKGDYKQATNREDIFVRIRWFYTPYNLEHYHRTVGLLRTCRFGKNEVVLSNHFQVIPAVWIVRKVRILCFNEEDKSNRGDYIGPKDRWYRYHFKVGLDRIMTRKDQALPRAGCGLRGCGLRYSPDEEVQRFCPRWLCRKWWHEECLRNLELVQPITPYFLRHMLHDTPGFRGPDDVADDETLVDNTNSLEIDKEFEDDLFEICLMSLKALEKLERDVIRVKDFEDKNLTLSTSILRNEERYLSMEKVLWCARSPIVRGKEHGVVGTGELVSAARNILKKIVDDAEAEDLPYIDPEALAPFASYKLPILPIFSCPDCGYAI